MAEYALTNAPYPGVNSNYKHACLLPVVVTLTAGVAAINVARSASGFTIAGDDAGVYTGTAPKAERGLFWTQVLHATPDDYTACVKSYNPATGVFAFDVHNAAAVADITGEVWLFFVLEGG